MMDFKKYAIVVSMIFLSGCFYLKNEDGKKKLETKFIENRDCFEKLVNAFISVSGDSTEYTIIRTRDIMLTVWSDGAINKYKNSPLNSEGIEKELAECMYDSGVESIYIYKDQYAKFNTRYRNCKGGMYSTVRIMNRHKEKEFLADYTEVMNESDLSENKCNNWFMKMDSVWIIISK